MRSLRIAFFSHDAEVYGASRSMITLAKGLQDQGIECLIIVPHRGPLIDYIVKSNLKYFVFYYPSWFYKPTEVPNRTKFLLQTVRVLLHKELNKKLKEYDLLVSNTSAIAIGMLFAIKLRKSHIWYIRELASLHYGFKYVLGRRLFFYLIDKSKLRLFNSVFVMNYYATQLKNENINEVVYNGIYTRKKFIECKDEYRANQAIREGVFTFCLIGFIHSNKGQLQAVDAMAEVLKEFSDIQLLIVGSGESAQLQQYIDNKNIASKITLTGYLSDVHPIFMRSHCLLNCAKFEAFGRTTVEAMAYTIPVIGNDTGGTSEIIQHNHTGLLYNGTTEELVACMKILFRDPALAARLGDNGWKEAYEKYTIEQYIGSFSSFIERRLLSG